LWERVVGEGYGRGLWERAEGKTRVGVLVEENTRFKC